MPAGGRNKLHFRYDTHMFHLYICMYYIIYYALSFANSFPKRVIAFRENFATDIILIFLQRQR